MSSESYSFLESPPAKVAKQLLYIVYGDDPNYHVETKLSILSILRQTMTPDFSIRVMTDRVEEYQDWPVETLKLTPALLQAWLGSTQYHYRRKVMGIYHALDYAEKTLFIDTDTVFKRHPNELFSLFQADSVIVDQIEIPWQNLAKSLSQLNVYLHAHYPEFVNAITFNSGVLGFYQSDAPLLQQSADLIDELYAVDPKIRILEQLVLAFVMHGKRKIVEHPQVLYHYFSKKEMFHEMGKTLFRQYGSGYQSLLVEKSRDMPDTIIRPAALKRLMIRLKIRKYPKKQHSGLVKLLSAIALGTQGYEADHAVGYWVQAMRKDFPKYNLQAYEAFKHGIWPDDYKRLVPVKAQQALLDLLIARQLITA